MPVTFEQVLDLVQMAIIVIGMMLLHNSVPSGQLKRLLDTLDHLARQTPTPVDDAAVNLASLFSQLLTGQSGLSTPAAASPTPPSVVVMTTASSAPESSATQAAG